jgi:hypothetical protein
LPGPRESGGKPPHSIKIQPATKIGLVAAHFSVPSVARHKTMAGPAISFGTQTSRLKAGATNRLIHRRVNT